jgi:hypothetical protein
MPLAPKQPNSFHLCKTSSYSNDYEACYLLGCDTMHSLESGRSLLMSQRDVPSPSSGTMKMEVVCSFKMFVKFYQTSGITCHKITLSGASQMIALYLYLNKNIPPSLLVFRKIILQTFKKLGLKKHKYTYTLTNPVQYAYSISVCLLLT